MFWTPKNFQDETWTLCHTACQAMWKQMCISSNRFNKFSLSRYMCEFNWGSCTLSCYSDATVLLLQHFLSGKDVLVQDDSYTGTLKSGPARCGRLQRICGRGPKRTFATWKVPASLTFKTSMLMSRQFVAATRRVTSAPQHHEPDLHSVWVGGSGFVCLKSE